MRTHEPPHIGVKPAFVDERRYLYRRLNMAARALEPYHPYIGSAGENRLEALWQRP